MWNLFRKNFWGFDLGMKNDASADPLRAALYERGACPDCGGTMFSMGPHGGMAQCIKCSNEECGSEFRLAPFDGEWLGAPFAIDRVGRSEEDSKAVWGRGYGRLHPAEKADA